MHRFLNLHSRVLQGLILGFVVMTFYTSYVFLIDIEEPPLPEAYNLTAGSIYPVGHSMTAEERCPNTGEALDLLIIIMSSPSNVQARTAIRHTWGSFGQRTDVSVLFILGETEDTELEALLQNEQKLYNDIIRARFSDSYLNLTLKAISMLEWTDKYCSRAKFLLKTDDDMFINVPRLLLFIKNHESERNVIFGRLAKSWPPNRNKRDKYYVSKAQFQENIFPDFTTGPAYLVSRDVIGGLFEAAMDQRFFQLEDVFMTGFVADRIGVRRVHADEFVNVGIYHRVCNVQGSISIHEVQWGEQFDLWKKLLNGENKC